MPCRHLAHGFLYGAYVDDHLVCPDYPVQHLRKQLAGGSHGDGKHYHIRLRDTLVDSGDAVGKAYAQRGFGIHAFTFDTGHPGGEPAFPKVQPHRSAD